MGESISTDATDAFHVEMKSLHTMDSKSEQFVEQRIKCEILFNKLFNPRDLEVVRSLQTCLAVAYQNIVIEEICYYGRADTDPHCLVCGTPILRRRLLYTDSKKVQDTNE